MERLEPGTGASSVRAILIGIGVIAIFVAVFYITSYFINRSTTLQFAHNGLEVKGEIAKVNVVGSSHSVFVTYRFTDKDGKIRMGNDDYPFPDAKSLKSGQPIEIIYLPGATPRDISRIARKQVMMMEKVEHMPWGVIGVIVLMLLGILGLVRKKKFSGSG